MCAKQDLPMLTSDPQSPTCQTELHHLLAGQRILLARVDAGSPAAQNTELQVKRPFKARRKVLAAYGASEQTHGAP